VIYIWVSLKPDAAPVPQETVTRSDRMSALGRCWAIVLLFVVVIGGIYAGFFTPTEAAGIGAAASLVLGLVLGRLKTSNIASALKETVYQSSMIFAIAIGGKLFVNFIALTGMAGSITALIDGSGASVVVVIGLMVVMYIFLGMFLDPIGIILLTLPLTIPIVESFGFSLIWFGVVVIKLLEIGLVTPPIGLNVFVIKSIVGDKIKLESIFTGVAWFLCAEVFVLGLILTVPALSLWLTQFV